MDDLAGVVFKPGFGEVEEEGLGHGAIRWFVNVKNLGWVGRSPHILRDVAGLVS